MVNFTWEVKRDLMGALPEGEKAAKATLTAMLAAGGSAFDGPGVEFVSENESVAEYFLRLAERAFSVRFEVTEATKDKKRGKDRLTLSCGGAAAARIIKETGFWRAHPKYAADRALAVAYVIGAFLGSGSCTLPRDGARTGYHLEFVLPTPALAEGLRELLDSLFLVSGIVARGDRRVVYLKSREAISDFLDAVGAASALRKLSELSAVREESNNRNRVSNCYAGNADRTAIANAAQVLALEKLRDGGGWEALDETLRQTAVCRLENPALSLAELADKLKISKSGLNHRLRKLMKICAQTEERI